MIISSTNPLALPVLLVLWVINAYLALLLARFILSQIRAPVSLRYAAAIMPLTDPPHALVRDWLASHVRSPLRSWVTWSVMVVGCLVAQQLLTRFVLWLG